MRLLGAGVSLDRVYERQGRPVLYFGSRDVKPDGLRAALDGRADA